MFYGAYVHPQLLCLLHIEQNTKNTEHTAKPHRRIHSKDFGYLGPSRFYAGCLSDSVLSMELSLWSGDANRVSEALTTTVTSLPDRPLSLSGPRVVATLALLREGCGGPVCPCSSFVVALTCVSQCTVRSCSGYFIHSPATRAHTSQGPSI